MANVHGFGDYRPNGARNQQGYQNVGIPNQRLQQIPFMNSGRTNRPPLQQSIPYTLKSFCCPNFKFRSVTFILLILLWTIYIICLCFGINYDDSVLEVSPDIMLKFGAVNRQKIKDDYQVYRLLTAAFLHWDLLHITTNTISALFFLSRLQPIYPVHYIITLLFCSAISGNLTTAAVNKDMISAGASTMLFGVLGAFIGYLIINWTYLAANKNVRSILCCIISFMVIISLILSFGKHTDYLSHIGGLVGGLFTFIGLFPAINQKNKVFTAIGAVGLLLYNIAFIIVLITV